MQESGSGTNRTSSDVRSSVAIGVDRTWRRQPNSVENDPERTSRCFGLGADIKNFAPELRSNNSSGLRSGIVCWWGCAAASMRYHDEIRVFSRLMAKSVVGNNQ